MHRPKLSIVIPVYNSAGIAPELVARIHHALGSLSFEIIMVNDGSQDESWAVVRSLALEHNEITAVNFRANMGQDNAILAGLRQAKGEYVVIMDDDLQHDPEDIRALLEKCKEGYDIVYSGFKVWNQSVTKKAGSRINGGLQNQY